MSRNVSVSQRRLRELAQRSVEIVGRHKGLDVSMGLLGETIVPAASAYMEVYDKAVSSRAKLSLAMAQGRESIAELNQRLRACLVLVRRTAPEYDLGQIDGTVDRPDRLMANAQQVIDLLAAVQSDGVTEALRQALSKAAADWGAARQARADLQNEQARVREHAVAFHRELVAFRDVMRHLLGSHNHDYQLLRSSHARNQEDIEETVEEIEDDATSDTSPSNGASNGAARLNPSFAA